ncbi:MAG: hypothetical protein QFC78_12100 [Pseudomonadota bacterium]|nr:hypothetical protein [Pseudomonadota bacterium]
MRIDEPLPKAGIFYLFVGLPIGIASIMAIAAVFISRSLGNETLPGELVPLAVSFMLFSLGLRALLSCIDWVEARKAKSNG